MKKALKIVGCCIGAVVIVGAIFIGVKLSQASSYISDTKEMTIVDMDKVEDGTYSSEEDAGLVKVKLDVTVKDHKLENINLIKHQNGKGKPAEAMLDVMLEKNTCDVDGVSGATLSSSALKTAVNHALEKGVGK